MFQGSFAMLHTRFSRLSNSSFKIVAETSANQLPLPSFLCPGVPSRMHNHKSISQHFMYMKTNEKRTQLFTFLFIALLKRICSHPRGIELQKAQKQMEMEIGVQAQSLKNTGEDCISQLT
nr:uncharacterized protein LOC123279323 isoform X2 [Equus asinus]